MIPLAVSAPGSRRPVATALLGVMLGAVFVHTLRLRRALPAPYCSDLTESARALRASADTLQGFVCRWGAIPDQLHRGDAVQTLVTSTFVHTGWLHLLLNLVFLAAFAPRVEEDLGRVGVVALFVGSATVAGGVHVLLLPDLVLPSIGASGGVAGVLGAHLLLAGRAQVRVLVGPVPVRLPTWYVLALWAGLQSVGAYASLRRASGPGAVSYDVHVVGFVVGLAVAATALAARPHLRRWHAVREQRPLPEPHVSAPAGGAGPAPLT